MIDYRKSWALAQQTTYRSGRHPSRRRQELRTFTTYAITRWLRHAGVPHVAYKLLNGAVRVYAVPANSLDRAALSRAGFSWSAEYCHAYRNAEDAPAWVPQAPGR